MAKKRISRRAFIKTAISTSAVGAMAASGAVSFSKKANAMSYEDYNKLMEHYDRGKRTFSFCEMCFWNCGLHVYTRGNRVHKIEGNLNHPNNYGHICAKGNSGIYELYGPNRLKFPMIRAGERGSGKWKKASWDEAFNYIGEKLKPVIDKYGPQSLASFVHGTGEEPFKILARILGTPNVVVPAYSQCLGSRSMGWFLTYGTIPSGHNPYDTRNAKYMISFGRNVTGAIQVREAEFLVEGLRKGGKLVVLDPRFSELAAKAYKWLKIRPGSDMAFALALIHVLIRDGLINYEFIEKYCYGFDLLADHVKQYTPQWAEKETDIPSKEIEHIAWEFAEASPNAIAFPARRFSRYGNDTQTVRTIAILNALIGNWGMPGGFWARTPFPIDLQQDSYCISSAHLHTLPLPELPKIKRADGAGSEQFPLAPTNLGRENGMIDATITGKPYPIKAWLVYDTNPIQGSANAKKLLLKEALKNLDLIVDIDIIPNDIGWYADVLLPESTYLERYDMPHIQADKYPFIALREPAVKPLFDTKPSWGIAKGIAKQFGLEKYYSLTPKEIQEKVISMLPKEQQKELKEEGVYVYYDTKPYPQAAGTPLKFQTPTGKIELYSTLLSKYQSKFGDDYSPMPKYKPLKQPEKGEFRLLFGRVPEHTHSRTQNNELLHEIYPVNKLWVNVNAAKNINLRNGDKVVVHSNTTDIDSLPIEVYATDLIREDCVFMAHGFGHISKGLSIAYHLGASDSFLCSNDVDPISSAGAFLNGFVTIKKI